MGTSRYQKPSGSDVPEPSLDVAVVLVVEVETDVEVEVEAEVDVEIELEAVEAVLSKLLQQQQRHVLIAVEPSWFRAYTSVQHKPRPQQQPQQQQPRQQPQPAGRWTPHLPRVPSCSDRRPRPICSVSTFGTTFTVQSYYLI